jgi:hypothetical protein
MPPWGTLALPWRGFRLRSYEPGVLPTLPAPLPGETVLIKVNGVPPDKDVGQSIRNVNHPRHAAFVALRRAAAAAMNGRAWYHGPIALRLVLRARQRIRDRTLSDYTGGIADTLDGGHGFTFTYLPIVFEDDCQVVRSESQFEIGERDEHEVTIEFLSASADQ